MPFLCTPSPPRGQTVGSLGATAKRGMQFFFAYEYYLIVADKTEGWQGTYFHSKWVRNAEIRHNSVIICWSIGFPGGSELNRSSEGHLKDAKMTVTDILESRNINGLGPKSNIWSIYTILMSVDSFAPHPFYG